MAHDSLFFSYPNILVNTSWCRCMTVYAAVFFIFSYITYSGFIWKKGYICRFSGSYVMAYKFAVSVRCLWIHFHWRFLIAYSYLNLVYNALPYSSIYLYISILERQGLGTLPYAMPRSRYIPTSRILSIETKNLTL